MALGEDSARRVVKTTPCARPRESEQQLFTIPYKRKTDFILRAGVSFATTDMFENTGGGSLLRRFMAEQLAFIMYLWKGANYQVLSNFDHVEGVLM